MEIERKWRIDRFPDLQVSRRAEIWQGYLSLEPEVRIRKTVSENGESYRLAVKGNGTLSREEVEPYITREDYEALCGMLKKPPVHKEWRGYDLGGGLMLEVSLVDGGEPTSFMYAEVEFPNEESAKSFKAPDFLGEEMTNQTGFRMKHYWNEKSNYNAPYVLASSSPRRRELLRQVGLRFEVVSPNADETLPENIAPDKAVELLSERKASAVSNTESRVIIAADTVVAKDGIIYGKPADEEDAFRMLRELSDCTHEVYTGVCVIFPDGSGECFSVRTEVTFANMTDRDIAEYITSGEPFGKAGSYAIQGLGAQFVAGINGDYANVVGLPVQKLCEVLKKHGAFVAERKTGV